MNRYIGFACKPSTLDTKGKCTNIPELNFKSTTAAWVNRASTAQIEQKIAEIVSHNLQALSSTITWLSTKPMIERCFRISSDLFPLYTLFPEYYSPHLPLISPTLGQIGERARQHGIRLSFHPGQFIVLASDSQQIIDQSVHELESYFLWIVKLLGYAKQKGDFKCNIHISGKAGEGTMIEVLNNLSPELRNILTIENSEFSYGLDSCLQVSKATKIPVVFDVHHHLIHSLETATQFNQINEVVDTWENCTRFRPMMHYSQSQPEHCFSDIAQAIQSKQTNKTKLRAHSDILHDTELNHIILNKFFSHFDIMVEAKHKNLASKGLITCLNS